MKKKMKIGLAVVGLVLLLSVLIQIPESNASVIKVKVNEVSSDGVDIYDFTGNTYDDTDVNEDGMIKIGEGYTSDGVHYEAFKPAVE